MVNMGVGILVLMGLGFAVVALPVAILYVVFKGLSGLLWVLGRAFGGLATGLSGILSGSGRVLRHLFRFARGMLGDSLRLAGGLLTAVLLLPLCLFHLALLRLRAARHYAAAIEDELASVFLSLYRLGIGHPARLLGLTALTEGFERRIPDVIARAPGATEAYAPVQVGDSTTFPGYEVVGHLRAGGSGARLYLARPTPDKVAGFLRQGHPDPGQCVIKSFALEDGSTLPQIVRESRALEAAKKLGLVLEHELTKTRFFYVMPYVDGDELSVVARRMHDASGPEGLADRHLFAALAYAMQLCDTLARFHRAGLWHKDIKPSNILVADGRVYLVDLGLVTPLQSAMTLTTHGTEYFRDPEMVRLAMKGVRVHEVDGVKFDLYSAGAVLYSVVEGSFPAHGSLSRITKRCPEALAWIVRRAMADMSARYASAGEMLRDLSVVAEAPDPFAVKPAELPSFRGESQAAESDPSPARSIELGPAPAPRRARRPQPAPEVLAAQVESAPSPRRRRRRRVARALAVGLFLLFSWGAGAGLIRHRQMRALALTRMRDERALAQARSGSSLEEADRIAASLAARPRERTGAVRVGGPAPDGGSATAWASSTSDSEETVLIFADLAEPSAEELEVLRRLDQDLEVQHCDVLGLSRFGIGERDERELALLPRVANQIGASLPADSDTVRRLDELVRADGDLDLIVWLVRGTGQHAFDGVAVGRGFEADLGSGARIEAAPVPERTYTFYGQ